MDCGRTDIQIKNVVTAKESIYVAQAIGNMYHYIAIFHNVILPNVLPHVQYIQVYFKYIFIHSANKTLTCKEVCISCNLLNNRFTMYCLILCNIVEIFDFHFLIKIITVTAFCITKGLF